MHGITGKEEKTMNNMLEEQALDAFDNGDEQTCFELYMKVIDSIKDEDIDEDGYFSLELLSCDAYYPSFKDYNGKIKFVTRVDDFFTEAHRKELKDAVEDVLESLYEGAWVSWDMATHPRAYLPD